jgi:hypothetical protein
MHAALEAGVLEPAADAAKTAQAANSIEKMLCHQMAAAHFAVMRLFKLSADFLERLPYQRQLQPGEVARLTNAAARLSEVYQSGCITLQKLKTCGRQQVVVQHVNVGPGGQAVVAGRLSRGRAPGGGVEKADEPRERWTWTAQERQSAWRLAEGATLRRSDPRRDFLPLPGNAKWPLPAARWQEHGTKNGCGS